MKSETIRSKTVSQVFRELPRTAIILVGLLGLLTILAWLVTAQTNIPMAGTINLVAFLSFTAIWGAGMVAMMFPSLLPMVYTLVVSAGKTTETDVASHRSPTLGASVRAMLFILGYVGIWTSVGVIFYIAIGSLGLVGLPIGFGSFGLWAGIVLILTGLYQFTRFKQNALMKCRSPISFIMTRWRSGTVGAGVMGVDYGWFCTRCCWVLMAGLLTVGAMSLSLMGVFAIIIFAEKIGPFGVIISKIVGAAFLVTGIFLIV